jgi:ribosomal-protein-alanine N-acetyltransferase
MTPTDLARTHAASFTTPRPWSAAELESFLSDPLCDLIEGDGGFALIRTIAGEAELLTIAVEPDQRRHGRDNQPAIRLYETTGFVRTGQRPQYYRKPDGTRVDAWLMALPLQACTG